MNISIVRIANGWVVTIATQQGQQAIFCEKFEEVIQQLQEIQVAPPNVVKLPNNRK